MFIFSVNALVDLFFGAPHGVLFSNILIVLGIIFSIVFPMKAPAYFIAKKYVEQFKRFNWSIQLLPGSSKGEDDVM